ncbi:MAG: hypothetical protein LV473_22045 [Nitrospira sp.]|nr:hypothetical protein [Nitrospira sp.]
MNRQRIDLLIRGLMTLSFIGVAAPVNAQTVTPTPFHMVGHVQSFVLDPSVGMGCPASNIGARMTVNGIDVIIPCHSVILMPAAYKTPRQIFDESKGISKAQGQSGLARQDTTPPLAAFETSIDGNIVCSPSCRYIAGQVHISQQSLNVGAGFIKAIDVTTGELRVGADPTAPVTNADARLHINDPEIDFGGTKTGRYGKSNQEQFPTPLPDTNPDSRFPDDRFQVDQDNPTIHAQTGYPMCLPRSNADPDCPGSNRARDAANNLLTTYVMTGPDLLNPTPGVTVIKACNPACDPKKQVPLMVGDYITYQGTLASYPDPASPAQSITYVSTHTIEANLGIYTERDKDPAYVSIEPILIGTLGAPAICGSTAECQDRIKVEGFTTDPSRPVNVYAVDVTPDGSGGFTTTLRFIGPGVTKPAPLGRFRFITQKNARVLFDRNNDLRGATRELVARVETSAGIPVGGSKPLNDLPLVAHGLQAGQYQAPIGEYIYPEPHVLGGPQPILNFQCLSFLARGWNLDSQIFQRLDPWPGFNDNTGSTRFFSCTE